MGIKLKYWEGEKKGERTREKQGDTTEGIYKSLWTVVE